MGDIKEVLFSLSQQGVVNSLLTDPCIEYHLKCDNYNHKQNLSKDYKKGVTIYYPFAFSKLVNLLTLCTT